MKNILFVVLILLVSCQNSNDQLIQENQLLTQQNEALKNQLSPKPKESSPSLQGDQLENMIKLFEFSSQSLLSDTLVDLLY